jgi:tyrosyl-tRNA synthetase
MLEPLLYRLTFLPQDTIHSVMLEQHRAPENNAAKLLLVREVLAYVTGSLEKADAVTNYKKYFSLDLDQIARLTPDEAVAQFKNVLGTVILPRSAVRKEMTAVELLKNLGLKPSINQANKLVEQSGLKINGKTVRMDSLALENYPALHDRIYILKYGKKDFMTVIIEG